MAAWADQPAGGRAAWSGGPPPVNANVPWAADLGREIKEIIKRQAARAPRSVQVHLGPSQLGASCHRQVVGEMCGAGVAPATNHISDPWPSIIGTAVHAWLSAAFEDENARIGTERFLAELRVAPLPEHPGTTDLFDWATGTVADHKVLGPTSMAKIQSPDGPPRKYKAQLLLYWLGCLLAGLPARRIALIAYPRTAPTLDGMYVWGCEPGPEEIVLLRDVIQVTAARRQVAAEILAGTRRLEDVATTPGDECYFCPQFRPTAAYDGGPGCPGTSLTRSV